MLLLLAAAMIGAACGDARPSATAPTATAASAGSFDPMAYPPDGDAPCFQHEPPDPGHQAYAGLLRRIRAIDARTVELQLCAPDVALPARLAFPAFAINDTAWLADHIDPDHDGEQAIVSQVNGTGPYRLEGWSRGGELTLVRNDAYWGAPVGPERLVIRGRDDAAARLADLLAGSVDGIDDVGPGGLQAIEADVTTQAVPRAGLNTFYLGFNNTFAPFDNPSVRRAIAMAIDRERLVAAFFPAGSEVASHFAPCSIPFGCAGEPWYDHDPAAARELLAAAGFPDGFATTIRYRALPRPYLPDPTGVATELQAQLLATLNVRAELEVIPDDTFLGMVDRGESDGIHLLGRVASIPDASELLDPHFGTGSSREFGESIDAVVNALTIGATTSESGAREAAYAEANEAIRAAVPMIPIAHAGALTAYRADVDGALASPVGLERFAAMTPGDRSQFVWLAAEGPPGLYCADETARTAQLACSQLAEGLYAFRVGSATPIPLLAESCEPNPELTSWTCALRAGVAFHDGATLDANDVVLSFAVAWDAEHPLHAGREGTFEPFVEVFGGLLNPPG